MNKKSLILIVLFLYPLTIYAHSGWTDRMMQNEVDCIALFCTTLVIQIILSVLYYWKLQDKSLFRKARVICWRLSKRWDMPVLFSLFVPLLILPFLTLLEAWLYILAIVPWFIVWVIYIIWITKIQFVRPKRIWKRLYVVFILSVQQLIGVVLYCLTYDTPVIRFLFNNPDGWDRKDCWIYPSFDIIPYITELYLTILILLIVWHLFIYLIQLIIKIVKHFH